VKRVANLFNSLYFLYLFVAKFVLSYIWTVCKTLHAWTPYPYLL